MRRTENRPDVVQGVDLIILLLVYKALNGLGLKYISELPVHYEPSRPLGSSFDPCPQSQTKPGEAASVSVHHISGTNPQNCLAP